MRKNSRFLHLLLEPVLKLRRVKKSFLPHLATILTHLTSENFLQIVAYLKKIIPCHLRKITCDLRQKVLRQALVCLFSVSATVVPRESYAIFEGVRTVTFDTTNSRCDAGSLQFDPYGANNDYDVVLSNPVCIGWIASFGAVMLAADFASGVSCRPTNPLFQTTGATEAATEGIPPAAAYITPSILIRIAKRTGQCGTRTAEYSAQQAICATPGGQASCPSAALSLTDATKCCAGLGLYLAAIGAGVSALAVIYDQGKIAFENAGVCGYDWYSWQQLDANGNPSTGGTWTKVKGTYKLCLENAFLKGATLKGATSCTRKKLGQDYKTITIDTTRSVTNTFYREYIYGGEEFEDNGDNSCSNPSTWDSGRRLQILGYTSDKQRYYMTGPGNAPVYACQRFVTVTTSEADRAATQAAYDCCKRRSQNAICIENQSGLGNSLNGYTYGFCEIGNRCSIGSVQFEVYASKQESSYACAKTYTACPYDHLLGGGTEERKYDDTDATKVVNFCQFMNHCSKLPILPYIATSDLTSGFISSSCRDMKGDSQNVYGYTSELIPINTRGFSAPLVQCFKETMENVLLNKAGYTECIDPNEQPGDDGVCNSGYVFKKGDDLPTKSFFIKVQDSFQDLVKIALTLSIVFIGIAVLLAVPGAYFSKKVVLGYVIKIGLVMYFVVGDGWQFGFMQGILGASNYLADLTFKVDESAPTDQLDGCQFPRFNYADSDENTKYDNPSYPPTKDYLRTWDTLDCKIASALGFGPEVSVPNLVMMILGGFFTGGLGIIFFVGAFFFAFFLIEITVKAMHIFLMSITSVIILLYVSPITITCALFNRTKGIFDGWWKQMLGFTLQPMILFAYLGILISLFDKTIIGDVTFTPGVADDDYGRKAPKNISCSGDVSDTSIYCIFRVSDIKTYNGFEVLGIGLPMLGSMNATKLESIIKAALIMFVFSSFMDQISKFAAELVGGAELKSNWNLSLKDMASSSYNALRGIQKRGMGMAKKYGGKIARWGADGVKGFAHDLGNEGKSIKTPVTIGGGDHSSTTGGTGKDNVGSTKTGGGTGNDNVGSAKDTGDKGVDHGNKGPEQKLKKPEEQNKGGTGKDNVGSAKDTGGTGGDHGKK